MFASQFITAGYIDISAVSYAIPLIAGAVIAVSSAIYLRIRKVKSKISKTLGIDENAGKEVEEDVVITDDSLTESETPTTDNKTE